MNAALKRGMSGTLKQFDRNSHSKNDNRGKKAVLDYLSKRLGPYYKTIENPNIHGIDLITFNIDTNEIDYCWEVEIREDNWKKDERFPFSTINCLERKEYQWRKWDTEFVSKVPYKLSQDYKTFYVQVNNLCTRAVIIDGDVILDYPLVAWKNCKAEGEKVRQIPLYNTQQVRLIK